MPTKKRIDIILGARDTSRAVFAGYEARLGGLKRAATSLAAVAGVGIGFAVVGRGLVGAVKAGADFEQAIANVRAVMRSTNEEMEPLIALTKELGATTAFSAGQAAEAAEQYALAGFSQSEILKALPATLSLAAAGTLSMSEAATIGAQTLKQMGLSAEQLPEVVDTLALAASTANTDVRQLGEALGKTGVIGAGAGEDIQEITAALQLLADKGRQGQDAGTAMRNIYLRLQTGTEGVGKALKELGVSVGDEAGRMKPLATIVGELNTALANFTPMQQAAFRATIAGTRAAADFDIILGAGEAGLKRYTQRLNEAGGAAERMANDKLDSLQGDLKLVGSAAEASAISLTEFMNGGLRPAAQGLASLLSFTSQVVDQQGDWIVVAGAGAAALGGLKLAQIGLNAVMRQSIGIKMGDALWSIANAAPGARANIVRLTGAMVAQTVAAKAMRLAAVALRATLVGGLVTGLGLVITAFVKSRREGTSFGEALRDIGKQVGVFRNLGEEASDAAKKVGEASAKVVKAHAEMAAAGTRSTSEQIDAAKKLVEAQQAKVGEQRTARDRVEDEAAAALDAAKKRLANAQKNASTAFSSGGPFGGGQAPGEIDPDASNVPAVASAREEVERLERSLESIQNQTRLTLGKEAATLARAQAELARVEASDTSTPLAERLTLAQNQVAVLLRRLELVGQTRPLDLDVADAEARLQALAAQAKAPLNAAELKVATEDAQADLKALQDQVDALGVTPELKLEIAESRDRLAELRRQVDTTDNPQQLALDTREAQANLARLRAEAGVPLDLEARTTAAEAALQQLRIRAALPHDPADLKLETAEWETRLAALRQQVATPLPRQKLELDLTAAQRGVTELKRQLGEEVSKASRAAAQDAGVGGLEIIQRLRENARRGLQAVAQARATRDQEFELTAEPIQIELRDLQRDVDNIVQGIRQELSSGLIEQVEAERRIEQVKEAGRRRGVEAVRGELDALNNANAAPPRAGVEGIEISRRFLGLADSFRQQGERDAASRAARAAEDAAATAEKQRALLEMMLKALQASGRGGLRVMSGPLGGS